jgi:hypothetical protein
MYHKVHRKDLREGNIIPIFLSWSNQKNYRGDAILIKRDIDREPDEDIKKYEFAEIGSDHIRRKKEKISIIYSYQIWIIKFVNGPDKGFQTKVKIAYYKSTLYGRSDEDDI